MKSSDSSKTYFYFTLNSLAKLGSSESENYKINMHKINICNIYFERQNVPYYIGEKCRKRANLETSAMQGLSGGEIFHKAPQVGMDSAIFLPEFTFSYFFVDIYSRETSMITHTKFTNTTSCSPYFKTFLLYKCTKIFHPLHSGFIPTFGKIICKNVNNIFHIQNFANF